MHINASVQRSSRWWSEAAFGGALIIIVEFLLKLSVLRLLPIDEFPHHVGDRCHTDDGKDVARDGAQEFHGELTVRGNAA